MVFTGLFLAILWLTTARHGGKRIDTITKEACLDDLTFDYSAGLNNYFLTHLVARDWVMMFNAWWFDITICGLLFLYKADILPSISFVIALLTSAFTKTMT